MGVARIKGKDQGELKDTAPRRRTGTTWRFKAITLLNEKPAYINTPCRITIDLRKSQVQALLQSTSFPLAPVSTVTIADVLQLKQVQRFEAMAIVTKVLEVRTPGPGLKNADVRLVLEVIPATLIHIPIECGPRNPICKYELPPRRFTESSMIGPRAVLIRGLPGTAVVSCRSSV